MEVKCPKCRLKYTIDIPLGLSEIACACPRCGTPFTHVVESDMGFEPINDVEGEYQPTEAQVDTLIGMTADSDSASVVESTKSSYSESAIRPVERISPYVPLLQPDTTTRADKKKRTRYMFLLFFVVFVIMVFTIRSCNRQAQEEAQMAAADVEFVEGVSADVPQESSSAHSSAASSSQSPKWLQGNWSVHTDYGVITLRISHNKIAETSGGRTSYGTYVYESGRIVCDFGDGQTMYYKVNESRKSIDAGNGMWMSKVD